MTRFFTVVFVLIWINSNNILAQSHSKKTHYHKLSDIAKINSTQNFTQTVFILFPLNPIFLVEDKKFYVGITKEISLGTYPYGRTAFEYSLIFRETHLNQVRVSYNFDIPIEARDLGAFLISVGGGYFTDFSKEGYFPQASANILLPVLDNFAANLYLKFRYTIMTETTESNIFDLSLGIGTYISF